LVAEYAGPDATQERRKLVLIGTSVVIPALLSAFTAYFFLGPFVASLATRALLSLFVATLVLIIDCIIVTTLVKQNRLGTAARIMISACMGMVIAEPVLLTLYQKTINSRIQTELENGKAGELRDYEERLQRNENESSRRGTQLSADTDELRKYLPGNISIKRLQEKMARAAAAMQVIQAAKDVNTDRLEKQKAALDEVLRARQQSMESLIVEMSRENDGKRESGRSGRGAVYNALALEKQRVSAEIDRARDRVTELNGEIDAVQNDRTSEALLDQPPATVATVPGTGAASLLLSDERNDAARLRRRVADTERSLVMLATEQAELRARKARLNAQYDPSNHDDSLTQTRVLYAILADNWFLRIKVAALFLLVFLIDLTPILVKLTARTGYDDYLATMARARIVASQPARLRFHEAAISAARAEVQQLCDFRDDAVARLTAGLPEQAGPSPARSIVAKIAQAVEQRTDEMLGASRYGPIEDRRPTTAGSFWSAIQKSWTELRARF